MNHSAALYKRHRFPPAIIQYAFWLYHRFSLSHHDIEDLLAERRIDLGCESVRPWCNKFGPLYAQRLRRKHPGFGDTFFVDEYLQARSDAETTKRFFRRLLRSHGTSPRNIVTDKLGSYGVARRELMPTTIHDTDHDANNRAELSHQPTRARERGMRRFSSPEQAQRFLSAHAAVYSLFDLQRHLASAAFHRFRRARAFECWNKTVAA